MNHWHSWKEPKDEAEEEQRRAASKGGGSSGGGGGGAAAAGRGSSEGGGAGRGGESDGYGSDGERRGRGDARLGGGAGGGGGEDSDGSGGEGGGGPGCDHVACQKAACCIIEELITQKKLLAGQHHAQYRQKPLTKAIGTLITLERPLTLKDVPGVIQGQKTIDKITEIMQTGRLERNRAMQSNDRFRAVRLFVKVWGVGESTAERWYQQGCRSLKDVAKLDNLSEQQRVGLKHFEDFEDRISRDEVAEAEDILTEAMAEVFQARPEFGAGGMTRQQLLDARLHVRVTGSYLRGLDDTGDIDVVIAAPPMCGALALPPVLEALLARLFARGTITDDMRFDGGRLPSGSHQVVTYMGVYRGPGRERYRRIDIKVRLSLCNCI
ncbi:MAG: fingers domain of DNA polymerase lambda-domain-containing protein [Monoraphidium minutum]|nr:MAG: fingers domain of DNA polymerase lambda-domain-containing protein [Monoraphidium minutum]